MNIPPASKMVLKKLMQKSIKINNVEGKRGDLNDKSPILKISTKCKAKTCLFIEEINHV